MLSVQRKVGIISGLKGIFRVHAHRGKIAQSKLRADVDVGGGGLESTCTVNTMSFSALLCQSSSEDRKYLVLRSFLIPETTIVSEFSCNLCWPNLYAWRQTLSTLGYTLDYKVGVSKIFNWLCSFIDDKSIRQKIEWRGLHIHDIHRDGMFWWHMWSLYAHPNTWHIP